MRPPHSCLTPSHRRRTGRLSRGGTVERRPNQRGTQRPLASRSPGRCWAAVGPPSPDFRHLQNPLVDSSSSLDIRLNGCSGLAPQVRLLQA